MLKSYCATDHKDKPRKIIYLNSSKKMGSTNWAPLLLLISATALSVSAAGEFLMGGHLDNKKVTGDSSSHLVLTRTSDDGDLDLIAEESSASVASTPYPDQEPRYVTSMMTFYISTR